jgi:hypothetical protein
MASSLRPSSTHLDTPRRMHLRSGLSCKPLVFTLFRLRLLLDFEGLSSVCITGKLFVGSEMHSTGVSEVDAIGLGLAIWQMEQ